MFLMSRKLINSETRQQLSVLTGCVITTWLAKMITTPRSTLFVKNGMVSFSLGSKNNALDECDFIFVLITNLYVP